jgi:putative endonuclease
VADDAVARRRAAERRGRRAEAVAALYLNARLYRIVARRLKTPVGEIDLIARRGRTVAFVEVKARDNDTAAQFAVTPAAQQRIARAAAWWLQRNPWAAGLDFRFDVIVVGGMRLPRHSQGAFDAGGVG